MYLTIYFIIYENKETEIPKAMGRPEEKTYEMSRTIQRPQDALRTLEVLL